ncbi:hypothetical protein B0H14DRAFT_2612064 [Mycena olivaceomarginata]|nr:hypothetical protein B0H14DRAFT_2612064 [Mycena olivaceomarginata]
MLVEKRMQESAINPKSGHHLQLGHQTAPEETAPFNEFWLVFHEPKFNPGVNDEGLPDDPTSTDFSSVSEFQGGIVTVHEVLDSDDETESSFSSSGVRRAGDKRFEQHKTDPDHPAADGINLFLSSLTSLKTLFALRVLPLESLPILTSRYENRGVGVVPENVNLVSKLSYSKQTLIEAPVGDGCKIALKVSKDIFLRIVVGLGPNLIDHSDDISSGAVGVCTKKLADRVNAQLKPRRKLGLRIESPLVILRKLGNGWYWDLGLRIRHVVVGISEQLGA